MRLSVVPFGREQAEVGRPEASGAGVTLSPKRLTPDRLRAAARQAISLKFAAVEMATKMAAEGGAPLAVDHLEALDARSVAAQ